MKKIGEGDFEEAVFSLDSAVRKLEQESGAVETLVRAYLYLGAAYVGLDHESSARAKFRKALQLQPGARLEEGSFPRRVFDIFEEEVLALTATHKKRSARRFLILGGVGAGVAVGVAAATRGSELPPNRNPTVTINVTPERAIVDVTTVTFAASADDPDGDPLTYAWDLGDGTRASGPTVTHVYAAEARFDVNITVSDGRGGSATAQQGFVARSLTGHWGVTRTQNEFDCVQNGASLDCRSVTPYVGINPFYVWAGGRIVDPFTLDFQAQGTGDRSPGPCPGEVQSTLLCMVCADQRGSTLRLERRGADPYGAPGGCNR